MQKRSQTQFRFLLDDVRLSVKALASLRSQLALAMLLALSVVLSYFGGFYLTQDNKIATSFLAMALAGYLYGAVPAALVGALTDLIPVSYTHLAASIAAAEGLQMGPTGRPSMT